MTPINLPELERLEKEAPTDVHIMYKYEEAALKAAPEMRQWMRDAHKWLSLHSEYIDSWNLLRLEKAKTLKDLLSRIKVEE